LFWSKEEGNKEREKLDVMVSSPLSLVSSQTTGTPSPTGSKNKE